jgi:uncharacterized damage-inducible protein DinB
MSNTATSFELKSFLTGIVQRSADRLSADLAHLSAEQLTASPMGAARNPLHFTAECIGFNRLVANAFVGKPSAMPSQEERDAFFASIDTLEKAQAGLKRSADTLGAAIDQADEAKLTAEGTAPWGEPMPLYMLVYMAADHMSYHDGQVNYIQTLYGDAEVHWG